MSKASKPKLVDTRLWILGEQTQLWVFFFFLLHPCQDGEQSRLGGFLLHPGGHGTPFITLHSIIAFFVYQHFEPPRLIMAS
jgi:hypothetical protein